MPGGELFACNVEKSRIDVSAALHLILGRGIDGRRILKNDGDRQVWFPDVRSIGQLLFRFVRVVNAYPPSFFVVRRFNPLRCCIAIPNAHHTFYCQDGSFGYTCNMLTLFATRKRAELCYISRPDGGDFITEFYAIGTGIIWNIRWYYQEQQEGWEAG